MDKDRLDLLKETEGYIPPIHTLGTGELQSFYSQFGAAPEIIREMFLSREIFQFDIDYPRRSNIVVRQIFFRVLVDALCCRNSRICVFRCGFSAGTQLF